MKSSGLIAITFLAGLCVGWFGKVWVETYQLKISTFSTNAATSGNQNTAGRDDAISGTEFSVATQSELAQSSQLNLAIKNTLDNDPQLDRLGLRQDTTGASIVDTFHRLLNKRSYFNAIALFQEQKNQNEQVAAQLKVSLVDELQSLIETRSNNDFSKLVEQYLSFYYDDIDVLLLLTEFNRVNSRYLEVVNVFLLAKTYAYSHNDQKTVDSHFNRFVMEVDSSYTEQKDWWSLINLYTHIDASGLMTPTYQYQQALAHLRSGDETFAIEQFNQLLGDSLVGDSAAKILSTLTSESENPTVVYESVWGDADSIALQKVGNQFAVNLDNSRKDSVTLLIDTGASMTAISRDSFNALNASGDAVEQDRLVFHTANGPILSTVFSIPELHLGPHQLENTQIAVIEFDNSRGIDGLLGMNILDQFRFQIEQDNLQLLLSKK